MPPRDSSPDLAASTIALVPTHAVPSDGSAKVIRRGGRPKKVDPRPTVSEIEYGEQLGELRDAWLEDEQLVRLLLRRGRATAEVFQEVRLQLAEECAVLGFAAQQAEARGRDATRIRQRRIDGLLRLAQLEVARAKMGIETFDIHSPKVAMVVESFLGAVGAVLEETIGHERSETVMGSIRRETAGWRTPAI